MAEDFFKDLSPAERKVIVDKGTEAPFTGEYDAFYEVGVFVCRACSNPLYDSSDKFDAGCGWPAFDRVRKGAVNRVADHSLGRVRTEIACAQCKGHLGHVFEGEQLTPADSRHCVNSLSIRFIPNEKLTVATFGAGCFWGVEELYRKLNGVYNTAVGYMGGALENPSYEQVCSATTGHAEVVQVHFDPLVVDYNTLLQLFWDNHNPTTLNRQGQDEGPQYRSVVFYHSSDQKSIAEDAKKSLSDSGKFSQSIVTEVVEAKPFYRAEEYHQNYLYKRGIGSCSL
jgi:peptide methionine sulfoxide reductase msrA/msrB